VQSSISADQRRRLDKQVVITSNGIKYPMSGALAKSQYSKDFLSQHELTEVEEFEQVFYLAKNT
jgi:hypothetical protein